MTDFSGLLASLAAAPFLIAAVAIFVFVALYSPLFRASFILLGTLLLFQTEAIPTGIKSTFVILALLFGLISLKSIGDRYLSQTLAIRRAIRVLLYASLVSAAVAAFGMLSATWTHVPIELLIRDAINYTLIPAVLVVGIDAGLSVAFTTLCYSSVVVGILGSVSTMVAWLQRREGDGSSFSQFGLASSFPVYCGVAVCLGMYFGVKRGRTAWLLIALLQIGIVVSAGGRQAMAVFAVAVVVAIFTAQGNGISRISRILLTAAAAAGALLLVVQYSNSFGGGIAVDRFQFFTRLLEDGLGVIQADGSTVHRTSAYTWMYEAWQQHPLVGQGLGQSLPSVRTGQITYGLLTLDTPLVIMAKFGIVGTILLAGALVMVFFGLARLITRETGFLRTVFAVNIVFVVSSLPNGFPTENRGFAPFVLIFVAVGIASVIRNSPSRQPQDDLPNSGLMTLSRSSGTSESL